jgi:hypothetical protein
MICDDMGWSLYALEDGYLVIAYDLFSIVVLH